MAKTAIGRRVKHVGSDHRYVGLRGTIIDKRPDSYCVRWNGSMREQWYGVSDLLVIWDDAEPTTEAAHPDPVNQPQHYQLFPDLEAIEVIARSTTQEQFYGYCLGNRLKYRLRAGNKDKLEQDIAKSDKYLELYEQYKGLCYGVIEDVEAVITPVPMPNLEDW